MLSEACQLAGELNSNRLKKKDLAKKRRHVRRVVI